MQRPTHRKGENCLAEILPDRKEPHNTKLKSSEKVKGGSHDITLTGLPRAKDIWVRVRAIALTTPKAPTGASLVNAK